MYPVMQIGMQQVCLGNVNGDDLVPSGAYRVSGDSMPVAQHPFAVVRLPLTSNYRVNMKHITIIQAC